MLRSTEQYGAVLTQTGVAVRGCSEQYGAALPIGFLGDDKRSESSHDKRSESSKIVERSPLVVALVLALVVVILEPIVVAIVAYFCLSALR